MLLLGSHLELVQSTALQLAAWKQPWLWQLPPSCSPMYQWLHIQTVHKLDLLHVFFSSRSVFRVLSSLWNPLADCRILYDSATLLFPLFISFAHTLSEYTVHTATVISGSNEFLTHLLLICLLPYFSPTKQFGFICFDSVPACSYCFSASCISTRVCDWQKCSSSIRLQRVCWELRASLRICVLYQIIRTDTTLPASIRSPTFCPQPTPQPCPHLFLGKAKLERISISHHYCESCSH